MENRTNKRMQWVIRLGCILGLMTALCGCSSTEVVKIAKYAAKEALKTTAPQKDRSEGESSSAKDADGKGVAVLANVVIPKKRLRNPKIIQFIR